VNIMMLLSETSSRVKIIMLPSVKIMMLPICFGCHWDAAHHEIAAAAKTTTTTRTTATNTTTATIGAF
jgi:hypothetical protein